MNVNKKDNIGKYNILKVNKKAAAEEVFFEKNFFGKVKILKNVKKCENDA